MMEMVGRKGERKQQGVKFIYKALKRHMVAKGRKEER